MVATKRQSPDFAQRGAAAARSRSHPKCPQERPKRGSESVRRHRPKTRISASVAGKGYCTGGGPNLRPHRQRSACALPSPSSRVSWEFILLEMRTWCFIPPVSRLGAAVGGEKQAVFLPRCHNLRPMLVTIMPALTNQQTRASWVQSTGRSGAVQPWCNKWPVSAPVAWLTSSAPYASSAFPQRPSGIVVQLTV
jgi:hypothetical protein